MKLTTKIKMSLEIILFFMIIFSATTYSNAKEGPKGLSKKSKKFMKDEKKVFSRNPSRRRESNRSRPPSGGRIFKKKLAYGGEQFRGRNTLYLKRALKQQFPEVNLRNKKLKAVILMAKSKHGRGNAALTIGQETSYAQIIPGNPYDFHDNDRYTYSRVRFKNLDGGHGRWQIQLKGNIKVLKVIVFFKGRSNDSLRLYIGDHFRGHRVLPLKRLLRQYHPEVLNKLDQLKKIILVAKSKHGHGTVMLKVGRNFSYERYIDGNPYDFYSNEAYTFSKVFFTEVNSLGRGPLQFVLEGNIKVREIIFEFYPYSYLR